MASWENIDFSVIGNLPKTYKEAQKERTLKELGEQIKAGGVDYQNMAGTLAGLGDIGNALALIKLREGRAASADADADLARIQGGNVDSATRPASAQPPQADPGMRPPASVPQAVPVAPGMSSGRMHPPGTRPITEAEAVREGLYPPKTGTLADLAPKPAPPAAPAQGEVPPLITRNPVFDQAINLLRIAARPNLPKEKSDIYKAAGLKALESVKDDPELKQYAAYHQQESASGRTPKPIEKWDLERRRATAPEKGEDAFETEFGKDQAKRWAGYITQGEAAQKKMVDINSMREISRRVGSQGVAAGVKEFLGPYAESVGVDISGLSDLQAYTSIIERLAPQQRVPGSGATSDIEYKGFKKAMPGLMTNPVSREAVLDTMEALERHSLAQGEIASRLATKEIKRGDAEKELRALPDPMAGFREWRKQNAGLFGSALSQPATTPPPAAPGAPKGQDRMPAGAPVPNAKQAPDGKWYVPDPARPGKFLQVQ